MIGLRKCFVTHNVLYAGAEHFILQGFVKERFYQQVTMSGIKDIAVGHIQLFSLIGPAFDGHIGYGAYGAVGKNAFCTERYRLYMSGFCPVPTFQGADTATVANHQHVIAESARKLLVVRIEPAFLDFQSLFEFTVRVNGLLLIKIDAVSD